jgi:hypothetical protein
MVHARSGSGSSTRPYDRLRAPRSEDAALACDQLHLHTRAVAGHALERGYTRAKEISRDLMPISRMRLARKAERGQCRMRNRTGCEGKPRSRRLELRRRSQAKRRKMPPKAKKKGARYIAVLTLGSNPGLGPLNRLFREARASRTVPRPSAGTGRVVLAIV